MGKASMIDTRVAKRADLYTQTVEMCKLSMQQERAGLNHVFPRSDPLLQEFASFLQVSGAAVTDITNNVIHTIYTIIIVIGFCT